MQILAPGLEPAAAQDPPSKVQQPNTHYQAALADLSGGNTDRAALEVKLAIQENPLDAASHYLLGGLLERISELAKFLFKENIYQEKGEENREAMDASTNFSYQVFRSRFREPGNPWAIELFIESVPQGPAQVSGEGLLQAPSHPTPSGTRYW